MSSDPFRQIRGAGAAPQKAGEWTPVVPVPDDAPPPPAEHPKLGPPTEIYTYRAADGRLNGYVMRFDRAGGKEFRPLTYCRHPAGRLHEWRWSTWQKPRPLFNLDKLHKGPAAPVLIVEGEKACGAAEQLAPGYVCITSPGGSKAAAQADWTALNGREVVIWPDNDDPGRQYAATAAKQCGAAGALRVSIIEPPGGLPAGWDAADALADGFDEAQIARLIATAAKQQQKLRKPADDDSEGGGRRRWRPPQRDQLMVYLEGIELWRDDAKKAYATYPVDGHYEHAPVQSPQFRRWLTLQYFQEHVAAPSDTAIKECLNTAEAIAVIRGPRYTAFIRVAEHNGRIYHDLCNDDWQAVEITRDDWNVVKRVPVKFIRREGMLALPIPERVTEQRAGIEELRSLFGNLSQAHFALVVAWLMSCFRDTGDYPVLMIHAGSDSGKSFLTNFLMDLIDPRDDKAQGAPKDEENLFAFAKQTCVVGFDNISHIPNWLSDALCRLSSGGTLAKVKKYTDDDLAKHKAKRPIIINGIPKLAEREDLASRTLLVSLLEMAEGKLTGPELEERSRDAYPRILAGLYDGLRAALNNFDRVKLHVASRLIGPLKWATAAEPSFGFDDGQIFRAYQDNERDTLEMSFEADAVAQVVARFVRGLATRQWEGTSTKLWNAINEFATPEERKSKSWPNSAAGLTGCITRATRVLRAQGIYFERHSKRKADARLITLFERVAD